MEMRLLQACLENVCSRFKISLSKRYPLNRWAFCNQIFCKTGNGNVGLSCRSGTVKRTPRGALVCTSVATPTGSGATQPTQCCFRVTSLRCVNAAMVAWVCACSAPPPLPLPLLLWPPCSGDRGVVIAGSYGSRREVSEPVGQSAFSTQAWYAICIDR